MTRRQARSLRSSLTVWAITSCVSTSLQRDRSTQNVTVTVVMCLVITLIITGIYRRLLPRIRSMSLLSATLVTGFALLAGVAVSIALVAWGFLAIQFRTPFSLQLFHKLVDVFAREGAWKGIVYGYGVVLATTLGIELARRLGPQRLVSLILGRYRSPKEERRTFLLIDLRDSTPLAESLGAVRFSALLRDLFRDLTEPVVDAGGEVVGYVGDEAIVSWPSRQDPAEAVRCFMALRARLAKRAAVYERTYGAVPRIKGAVHRGPVVITEVGELRTDVAFLGDALNTASRILDECGPRGADLLISGPTAEGLPCIPGLTLEPLGAFPLRGKGEPLALVRANFDA